MNDFEKKLLNIHNRISPPDTGEFLELLGKVNSKLAGEGSRRRPADRSGFPGGLVYLKKEVPTVIIPDLHARINFLITILFHSITEGVTVLDMLGSDSLQMVCAGDGLHSETHPYRWKAAEAEFAKGFISRKHMDAEMKDGLGAMEIVMELKCAYPDNFHFLKGNHENIKNERGQGNFPFVKYADEGAMVFEYFKNFYGSEILNSYYHFEKRLPLLAVGNNFLISHAEPAAFYDKDEIINYRDNWDIVRGLTWTDNYSAEKGSVERMLDHFMEETERPYSCYFGGHRPVNGLFALRAGGSFIQIHNPQKYVFVLINGAIEPEKDIFELEDLSTAIISELEIKRGL